MSLLALREPDLTPTQIQRRKLKPETRLRLAGSSRPTSARWISCNRPCGQYVKHLEGSSVLSLSETVPCASQAKTPERSLRLPDHVSSMETIIIAAETSCCATAPVIIIIQTTSCLRNSPDVHNPNRKPHKGFPTVCNRATLKLISSSADETEKSVLRRKVGNCCLLAANAAQLWKSRQLLP